MAGATAIEIRESRGSVAPAVEGKLMPPRNESLTYKQAFAVVAGLLLSGIGAIVSMIIILNSNAAAVNERIIATNAAIVTMGETLNKSISDNATAIERTNARLDAIAQDRYTSQQATLDRAMLQSAMLDQATRMEKRMDLGEARGRDRDATDTKILERLSTIEARQKP